jgi:hypothetical protein
MGKLLDHIGPDEESFIAKQKVFFVATSPLSASHRVNLSPKAPGSSLVVLGPHKVGYIDLTGSGAETAAHVVENGRMTIMCCNLEEGLPKILRMYGTAELIIKEDVDSDLLGKFPEVLTQNPGFRSVFILTVNRVTASCGFSLPIMTYQRTRSTLDEFSHRKGKEGMQDYCVYNNSFSIDGLPSVAQLRNPNATIGAKPEAGYIHGEIVADQKPTTKLVPYSIRNQTISSSLKSTLMILFLGFLVFVSGIIFALEILPLFFPSIVSCEITSGGYRPWTSQKLNFISTTEL